MKKPHCNNRRGFTLIELLIVLAMFSIVVLAVNSLYSAHQQSAFTQDAVVDLQQNLRIGMDNMARDIKMAGFQIPGNSAHITPVSDNGGAGNSDILTITSASAWAAFAKIAVDRSGLGTFQVEDANSVDFFQQNDAVMIIRPSRKLNSAAEGAALGLGVGFIVNGVPNRADAPWPTIPLGGAGAAFEYKAGDLIVRTGGGPYPNTITYCLGPTPACGPAVATCPAGQLCLIRIVNGGNADVIAQNMTDLQFGYLLDAPPLAEAPLNAAIPANLRTIRAVRVTLFGQTLPDAQQNIRRRQLESIIEIRNKNL